MKLLFMFIDYLEILNVSRLRELEKFKISVLSFLLLPPKSFS